jgi:hypothetical protein
MMHDKNLVRVATQAPFVLAKPAILRGKFRDQMLTFDRATVDSTGVFLVGELERLDQTIHEPLVSYTWSRDIDLREDVTLADEVSSFTNSSFAAAGGVTPGGKAWISKDANAITGIAVDIGKTAKPLTLWGMEVKWTIPELESAQRIGRPVDEQKHSGMKLKWNMDTDEQVYIGDTTLGFQGLFNNSAVTNVSNVVNGVSGQSGWTHKTPDEILADVNEILTSTWAASAWAQMPNRLMLPPATYGYVSSVRIGDAAQTSILKYLMENNIVAQSGGDLKILPQKWLIGRGASATDRMVAYTKEKERVRFPMVPLQRTPLEVRSLYQITTYYGRLGVVEVVYPETLAYRDGL